MSLKQTIKRANAFDARAAREARRYLEKLQAELTRRLVQRIGTKWDLRYYEEARREVVSLLEEIESVLGAKLREKVLRAGEIGKKLADEVFKGIALNTFSRPVLTLPFVQEAAKASATLVKGITAGVRAKIDVEIDQGVQGLKSGIEVIKSIADVRDFTGIALKSATQRAEDIFRTESSRIVNMATMSRYKQLDDDTDEELLKYWLATADSRTRQTHYQIWQKTDPHVGGVPIPFADDFILADGERAFGPSAPTLSVENVINCRCRMLVITKKKWLKMKGEK